MISQLYSTMITFWSWWWQVDNKQDAISRTILTISVPTLVILWFKWTSSYSKNPGKTGPLPPGPYGLPFLGYLPFLTSNLHERFTEMGQKYGPIFSLRLGGKLLVVLNSVDLVKAVVRDMDQTFSHRLPPLTALIITYGGSDIAFSTNNAHWRNMRKLLATEVLSKANLNAGLSFRTHEVRKTVNHIFTKTGTKFNLRDIAFNTEINVVTSMLWGGIKSKEGTDSGYIGDGFQEVGQKIVELIGKGNISDFFPILSKFDLQGRQQEMRRCLEFVNGIFDKIIEERIKVSSRKSEEDGRKDFLQIMLELKDQKDSPTSFNDTNIKGLLMDIVFAATDTTSTMVEWVMAEIFHNPLVKENIQEELTRVIGMNNILEESHLPRLTYLDAVIKETFRLHPPLPLLIERCAAESCMVDGYIIPKDTTVYMNIWAIQRDPNNWTNPLKFDPTRFLNEKWDYNGNNLKFLPFGVGRRICPGIVLGEKMLMYILGSLLHSFEWSLPKDEEIDLSDEFGLMNKKRKPLMAIPSQRLPMASLYMG